MSLYKTQLVRETIKRSSFQTRTNKQSTALVEFLAEQGISFEDARLTRIILEQRKLLELLRFVLLISSILLGMINVFKFELAFLGNHQLLCNILSITIFFQSFFLEILTFFSWYAEFQFYKVAQFIHKQENFFRSKQFYSALFEGIWIAIIPSPFTQEYTIDFTTLYTLDDRFYKVNEILLLIYLQRMWILFQVSFRLTDFYTSRIIRIGKLYSIEIGTLRVLKFVMKDWALRAQLYLNSFLITYSTLMLRVAEIHRPTQRLTSSLDGTLIINSSSVYTHYGTEIWFTYISMFTVGYGDIYPQTPVGRVIVIILEIVGLTFSSLFICNLIQLFDLNDNKQESHASSLIERMNWKQKIFKLSMDVARYFFDITRIQKERFPKYSVQDYQNDNKSFLVVRNKLLFQSKRQCDSIDGFSFFEQMQSGFCEFHYEIMNQKKQITKMIEQVQKIKGLIIQKYEKQLMIETGQHRKFQKQMRKMKQIKPILKEQEEYPDEYSQFGQHILFTDGENDKQYLVFEPILFD